MDSLTEAAVRHALGLAATYQKLGKMIDASVQADIAREVYLAIDRKTALHRRDAALRRAFHLLGTSTPISLIYNQIKRFEADCWPSWRHSSQPPTDASPLRVALFNACLAAAAAPLLDGYLNLPGQRQLRRIVTSTYSDVTRDE